MGAKIVVFLKKSIRVGFLWNSFIKSQDSRCIHNPRNQSIQCVGVGIVFIELVETNS